MIALRHKTKPLVLQMFLLLALLLTSFTHGGAAGDDAADLCPGIPVSTIFFDGKAYIGHQSYGDLPPAQIVSTHRFTGPGDYIQDGLEIFQRANDPCALFVKFAGVEPGTYEWFEYREQNTL